MRSKMIFWALAGMLVLTALTGCSNSKATATPSAAPTQTETTAPTATLTPTEITPTVIPPTDTPVLPTSTPWPTLAGPAPTIVGVTPGEPSGPYTVFMVPNGDLLYIKNGPGSEYTDIGAFSPDRKDIMRTGASKVVAGETWVEIQMPEGGTGWVRMLNLTEYVGKGVFCKSPEIEEMLYAFNNVLLGGDGWTLSTMVSPLHGLGVRYWRNGNNIPYTAQMSKSLFFSLDIQNWGPDPANGLDTVGTFSNVVYPNLLDVANAEIRFACGDATDAGPTPDPWPTEYQNANYFTIHKPGPPGIETGWQTWLIGFEYVEGKPYLFALIHFQWRP
jgi:hypothetical protein